MVISYRKTKEGLWVAFGPAAEVHIGQITITKKSGETKSEKVEKVGNSFMVNGIPHVYGYLTPSSSSSSPSPKKTYTKSYPKTSGRCRECHGPLVNAPHHRAMGGLCGNCAFDEYDC
jgi:hypothetical protein